MPKHAWRGLSSLAALFAIACSTAQLTPAPGRPNTDEPATEPVEADAGGDIDASSDAGTTDTEPLRPAGRISVFVEPEERAESILTAIAGAKTSLFVEMYLLSGYKFQDALIAAKRRGVDVKVVLNKTFPGNGGGADNQPVFTKLMAAGVPTVWAPSRFQYMHAKTVIVDGSAVWIMTMNMTVTSPTTNREFIVADRDPDDVAEAQQIFSADFENRSVTVAGRLLLSPKGTAPEDARTRLLALLDGAKTSVAIAGSDISDNGICEGLLAAKRRGVDVRVLFDAQTMNPSETAWAQRFKAAGLGVRGMSNPDLHAKAIVVDNDRAYLGSINFTTNSLYDNREVGLLFRDASEVAKVSATIAGDWAAAGPL